VAAKPKGPGRPAHEATPERKRQVEMMAAFGNTEDQIASILGISKPTLLTHYRAELDFGHVKANNAVAANIFRQATKDDAKSVEAAKFWLKTRAGWSEYAPAPPKEPPLGKKEQQQLAAETAGAGSEWGHLVH
jgi:hypothetical protein